MEYKPGVLRWLFEDMSRLAGLFSVDRPKVADCGCVFDWVESMPGHTRESSTRMAGKEITMMDTFSSSAVHRMVLV